MFDKTLGQRQDQINQANNYSSCWLSQGVMLRREAEYSPILYSSTTDFLGHVFLTTFFNKTKLFAQAQLYVKNYLFIKTQKSSSIAGRQCDPL
ncbi:MAG: hypothetical protein ACJAYF_001796 [Arenicella sp.]